jgi:hypothetical protein
MNLCAAAVLLLLPFDDITIDKIRALAKIYLRDSAEVPMSVDVTTVVTDPAGKVKHRSHFTEGMVFHGYNLASGNFSIRATKGGLTPFGLRDGLSGDLATFFGGSAVFDKEAAIQIHQATGQPVAVIVKHANCPAIDWIPKYSFPQHPCGAMEVTLARDERGEPAIQHVTFNSTGSPGTANIAHLGMAQIKAFQFGVDFQLKFLPGEDKPYLWPLTTVVSASTDKGTVTITNRYGAKR